MVRTAVLVLAASCARPAWAAFRGERAFLGADMQPEVVAKTLSHVEEEWKGQARTFMKCELSEGREDSIRDCDDTPSDFSKSCSTVVSAVVQGSSGNLKVMREYMGNVCSQDTMEGWHQSSCLSLADAIGMKMSASQYDNRANFQTSAVCDDFWSSFLVNQKSQHAKELVALKEQAVTAAKEKAEARVKFEKDQKDLEEAEQGRTKKEEAKEEADLDAERKMVATRTNRTAQNDDPTKKKAEAVEEAAKKAIEEATKLEEEPVN